MNTTFNRAEGRWYGPDGAVLGSAWAGNDASPTFNPKKVHGKNNPAMDHLKNIGPLPAGDWIVGPWHTHPTLGPICAYLVPAEGTDAKGRSGFAIHGPDRDPATYGQESRGCIATPRPTRLRVKALCPEGTRITVI